jgi:hypothetical protein
MQIQELISYCDSSIYQGEAYNVDISKTLTWQRGREGKIVCLLASGRREINWARLEFRLQMGCNLLQQRESHPS